MTKVAFKVDEVCAIIKECGKAGVREFSLNGMKISLGGEYAAYQTPEPIYTAIPEAIREAANAQTKQANAEEEQLIKQDELDQMLIEDPIAYEEAIRRGDLMNEKRA